jgi:hypothetical protein
MLSDQKLLVKMKAPLLKAPPPVDTTKAATAGRVAALRNTANASRQGLHALKTVDV